MNNQNEHIYNQLVDLIEHSTPIESAIHLIPTYSILAGITLIPHLSDFLFYNYQGSNRDDLAQLFERLAKKFTDTRSGNPSHNMFNNAENKDVSAVAIKLCILKANHCKSLKALLTSLIANLLGSLSSVSKFFHLVIIWSSFGHHNTFIFIFFIMKCLIILTVSIFFLFYLLF